MMAENSVKIIKDRLKYFKSQDWINSFDIIFDKDGFPVIEPKGIGKFTDEEIKRLTFVKWDVKKELKTCHLAPSGN